MRYTKLGLEQLAALRAQNWAVQNGSLVQKFKFPSHTAAAEFVAKVAPEADRLQHHPNVFIKYKWATFELKTNDIDELSNYDQKLAEKISAMYRSSA